MSLPARLSRMMMSAYVSSWQPLSIMAKRRRRYALFEVAASALPLVAVKDQGDCGCTAERDDARRYLARFTLRREQCGALSIKGTPSVIDLGAGLDAYLAGLGASFRRSIRKNARQAAAQGYFFAPFRGERHAAALEAVRSSLLTRSGGIVPESLFGRRSAELPRVDAANLKLKPALCAEHWGGHFGIFIAGGDGLPRLAAFTRVRRFGDLAYTLEFIGHGTALPAGVMDMLHLSMLGWLMRRDESLCHGLRSYMYGALEHAGPGLAAWKKGRGFRPAVLDLQVRTGSSR
jgi:hypothetical protein